MVASSLLIPGVAVAKNLRSLNSTEGGKVPHRIDNQMIVKNQISHNSVVDLNTPTSKKTPSAKVSEYGPIIYEAPEGETKILARSGEATYAYYGSLVQSSYENRIGEIVTCDNGEVYIKNPFSAYVSNTYLKGKREDNKIVFSLPQPVAAIDYYGEEIYFIATMMQYSDSENWYYPCNTEEAQAVGLPEITDQFVVNINEDGSYSMEVDDARSVIPGLIYSDDLAWTGYSEMSSEWKEFHGTLNLGPADGVEVEDVVVIYGELGHYAKLAVDGENVFVQGVFPAQPQSWIQGKLENNKVIFPSGQYIGEDLDYGYYTYFSAATFEEEWDDYYEEWYNVYTYSDEIVFDYDETTQTMTTGENDAIAYNTSDNKILYLSIFDSPVIKKQPAEISQTPQNPYDLLFYNYYENWGYSWLQFYLPMLNVDSDLLNQSDLYYKVFVDGDEFVFYSDDYSAVEDEMTLIPYNFNDNYDFICDGTYHEVYFYFDGAEEIGVQLCNVKDGDVIGESDIVSLNISTGVQSVADANYKQIESTKYFNLNGQEINNPSDGIFVKTVKYNDGSVKSFKVIKK